MRTCTIQGCGTRHYARGWCYKHYMRWQYRGGDPAETLIAQGEEDAFQRYTSRTETGCLEWTGTILDSGYGQVVVDNEKWRAHRLAWFRVNGSIPEDKVVNHKCFNKRCVEPEHLNLASLSENGTYRRRTGKLPKSGARNVRVEPSTGKFFAVLMKEGKMYYGKHRSSLEEAKKDAEGLRELHHGEFRFQGQD